MEKVLQLEGFGHASGMGIGRAARTRGAGSGLFRRVAEDRVCARELCLSSFTGDASRRGVHVEYIECGWHFG